MPTDQSSSSQKIMFNQSSPFFKKNLKWLYKKNADKFGQLIDMLTSTKEKIEQLTWPQLYWQSSKKSKTKTGINWEKQRGMKTKDGKQLYSIRLSRKARLFAFRKGSEMVAYDFDLDHK